MADDVTRGEFDMLRQMVAASSSRLDSIDTSGTRGVGVVQTQLTDVVKDLADLKAEVNTRFHEVGLRFDGMKTDVDEQFRGHARVHDQERRDRVSARRWLVGTGIAGIASMSAVLALLVEILRHVH